MEYEASLAAERQTVVSLREQLDQAVDAVRRAEALAADRLRALQALQQKSTAWPGEGKQLFSLREAATALREGLRTTREEASSSYAGMRESSSARAWKLAAMCRPPSWSISSIRSCCARGPPRRMTSSPARPAAN